MKIPVSAIPKYKGKETTHSDMADNVDIRRAIFGAVPEAISQTKDFAKHFGRNSQRESCKLIFDFLKNKLNYVADGDTQVIKLPSALLHTKKGDCKSYSVLTSAILTNLGIPHHFVLVSYNNDPTPSHIYVQTDDGCIIDAVWGKFNDEKKPTYRYEVKPNGQMKVKSISGVSKCGTYMGGYGCGCERCGMGYISGRKERKDRREDKREDRKDRREDKREDRKDRREDKREDRKDRREENRERRGSTAARIGFAAGRGIFLTLIKSNFDGFGSKLAKMDFSKISKQWKSVGGNPTALQDAIKKGSQKPSKVIGLLGKLASKSKTKVKGVTGFNVDALKVAIPTATTAVGTAIAPAAGTAAGASLGAVMVKLLPIVLDLLSAMKPAEDVTDISVPPIPEDDKINDDGGDGEGDGGGSNTTTYLLIGGAAIAAYFLLKKK